MKQTDRKGVFIAYVVVAILCAAMMCISASGKLTMNPGAVQTIHTTIGVPLALFPVLAVCLIAGGLGLLVGIYLPRVGVVAAAGLVLYFVGAHIAHIVVGDFDGLKAPIVPLLMSVIALTLRLRSTRRAGDRPGTQPV